MAKEIKTVPQLIKAITGRKVTGIFSTFGVKDSYNDIVHPGAFAKTIAERGKKALFLWGHDFASVPVATITEIKEIPVNELPDEIRANFPEATGGAEVTREYLDTPRGNEILTALKAGSPLQMSFGYDPVKFDFEKMEDAKYDWEQIRHLREVRLWEVSDVLWGANSATAASKALALATPLDSLMQQLGYHLDEIKAGRRNASTDQGRINQIAELAIELGADNAKMIEASDVEEVDAGNDDKSRAGLVPLTLLRAKMALLEWT